MGALRKRAECIGWMAAVACLSAPGVQAQVHRCVDSNGRTEYRATPCQSGTRSQAMPDIGTGSSRGAANASASAGKPSPGARDTYEIVGESLVVTGKGSAPAVITPLPTSFPPFSWPTGVAHDTDRDIVTVVTMGGEGYLYRYDARRKQWLDYRSMNNIDVRSLTYDAQRQLYVARTDRGATLLLSNQGQLLEGPQAPAASQAGRAAHVPRLGARVAPVTEAQLAPSTEPPSPQLAAGAELVVVTGYEHGVVRVRLNRPGQRVLLALVSNDKMLWRVEPTAGTTVVGILVASQMNDSGVIADKPLPLHRVQLTYATEASNASFRKTLKELHDMLGVTKVDAFKNTYGLKGLVEIDAVTPGLADLTLQGVAATRPGSVFSFELPTRDLRPASFRNDGFPAAQQTQPLLAGSKTVLASSRRQAYRITDAGLQQTPTKSVQWAPLPMPANFPELSWPTAVAYDEHQDIVAVSSLGGEGFLYRFDAKRQKWLDFRSLNNIDITSLAYDPEGKRYVGWTTDGSLLYLSNQGEIHGQKYLQLMLPGLGYLYDRGNERPPALSLAPRGAQTALVHVADEGVSMIWTYDDKSGQAQLTYRAPAKFAPKR